RILRAQAVIDQANSLYFPTLRATSSAQHHHHVSEGRFGFPTNSFENYTSSLSAQWLVFDGFSREYRVLAARYAEEAAQESYKDTQRLLADAVSQAFYRTVLAQKEMEINLELKSINEKFMKDAKLKMDAGTSTRIEVNNFLVNINDAEIAYLESKNSYDTSKIVLAELLGVPDAETEKFAAIFENSKVIVPSYEAALNRALKNRPDLKALQSDILSVEAQIEESKGQYYPKFFLEGSYGYSSFDKVDFVNKDRDSFIGASMSWDLFTGNSTAAEIAQKVAEKNEKLNTLKSQWFETISEIRQQRSTLLNVLQRVELQQKSADISKSIYEDTKVIFENGVTSITRVNEVLTNYSISSLNLALFRIEALRRKEILDTLMGINL
ncbi:MAG: TolC family protein, partial [Lentisphaeraceae bacterium]|nr:TolC family protein [Lentisphaeraceae bacterium]